MPTPTSDDPNAHPEGLGNASDPENDAAVREAMLDHLAEERDVWEFLNSIERYNIPAEERHQYYDTFVALVATRPPAERDHLAESGRNVFHYRLDTFRHDLDALSDAEGTSIKIQPTVEHAEWLAEAIVVPPKVQYLVYRDADGTTELAEHLIVDNITYMPPQSRLVLGRYPAILLPNGVPQDEAADFDTVDLFRDIFAFIGSYVYLPDRRFRALVSYYVMLTWIYDRFDVMPYLRAIGASGSGKTTLIQVLGTIAYRGIFAGGATTASPIFRILDRFHGTLVLDEADFGDSDLYSEIVKILNAGYRRGFPVLRSERGGKLENYDADGFDVYGPKILATRRRFSDNALESRCFTHAMPDGIEIPRRADGRLTVPVMLTGQFFAEAQLLRNALLLWRFRNWRHTSVDPYERLDGLDMRLNQILLPLLSISGSNGNGHVADDAVRHEILGLATQYQQKIRQDKAESWEGKVADALLARWKQRVRPDEVQLRSVNEYLGSEHPEVKLSPQKVGQMIRDTFGLAMLARGGQRWVALDVHTARALCLRYALTPEQYNLQP